MSFRLAGDEYGVDIMQVQEVILLSTVTEMPGMPDHVRGFTRLRGQVVPIIDLRRRFGLAPTDSDEQTRIIIVNVEDCTIGMVVDAVNDVLRITAEPVEWPPSGVSGIDRSCVQARIMSGGRLLALLNVKNLLEEEYRSTSMVCVG